MTEVQVETYRRGVAAGEHVVVDRLPGKAPAYVFLHGLGSVRRGVKSDLLFSHAARSGRSALRYDARGHGEASGELGVVTIGELIQDARQLLDECGPAILIGSSLGGLVAAFAAVGHPAVVGLALLAPALGFVSRLQRRLDAEGRMRTQNGIEFRVTERVLDDARQLDERALPGRLQVPTLVVHGTDDEVVPPALSERFYTALQSRRKQLWLVPGGGHRLHDSFDAVLQRLDALVS